MTSSVFPLIKDGIVTCTWSKDRKCIFLILFKILDICLAPNNSSEILIFDTNKDQDINKWKLAYVLDEHTQQVSGLDWNETTNKIISTGHDKNVLVYTHLETGKWSPELVIVVGMDRAGLCVHWNKQGTVFAVGCGNKKIFLGYWEAHNSWWTTLSFKVHTSSVISLAFHPKLPIIASASTDKKIIVSSCYIPQLEPSDKESTVFLIILYLKRCLNMELYFILWIAVVGLMILIGLYQEII